MKSKIRKAVFGAVLGFLSLSSGGVYGLTAGIGEVSAASTSLDSESPDRLQGNSNAKEEGGPGGGILFSYKKRTSDFRPIQQGLPSLRADSIDSFHGFSDGLLFPGLLKQAGILSYGWRSGERAAADYFPGFLFGAEEPERNQLHSYLSSFRRSPVSLKTSFKSSDLHNRSDSPSDLIRTDRFPFMKHDASFEAKWDFDSPFSVNIGYRWEKWQRDPSYWEKASTDEHSPRVGIKASVSDWLELGASFTRSVRIGSDYHLMEANPEKPEQSLLPKFSFADRTSLVVNFTAEVMPAHNLNLSFNYGFSDDSFKKSVFNLVDGTSWQSGAEIRWAPFSRLQLRAHYLHEEFTTRQAGVATGATGIFQTKDNLDTVGAGFDLALVPGKLNFVSRGSYSLAQSSGEIANMPSGPSELAQFESYFRYRYSDRLSLKCGYLFEQMGTGQNGIFFRESLGSRGRDPSGYNSHIVLGVINCDF